MCVCVCNPVFQGKPSFYVLYMQGDRGSVGGLCPTKLLPTLQENVPAYLSPAVMHLGPECQLVVMVRGPPLPQPYPEGPFIVFSGGDCAARSALQMLCKKTALKAFMTYYTFRGACKCVSRPAFCQRAGRSRLIQS